MTTRLFDDPATRERLAKLRTYWQRKSYECEQHAQECHDRGDVWGCERARAHATDADARASIVTRRMMADTEPPPGLADVLARLPDEKFAQIAPATPMLVQLPPLDVAAAPATLVDLIGWLRAQWERHLPGLPSEVWQRIGFSLFKRRGGAS